MNARHSGSLLLSAALLTGLHTGKRVLIPSSDTQEQNYVVHRHTKAKAKITAPLLWIEYQQDANGKTRTMRIKTQNNLATGAAVDSNSITDDAVEEENSSKSSE